MISDLLLISIGNSRTRFAKAKAGDPIAVEPSRVMDNSEVVALTAAAVAAADGMDDETARVLIASVNDTVADQIADALRSPGLPRVVRLARDAGTGLRIPITTALDTSQPLTVGVDRLLGALAAHQRSMQACVVISAGTAVTVDFVDQFGVFQGGVIAPGLAMMLSSLHTHTAALPKLASPRTREAVPQGPMGKTTADAMTLGCTNAIVGLCHRMIDRYAEANGQYPRVIATGGDAPLLFEHDDLIEHIVPDLVLMGMHAAWRLSHADEE